MTFNAIGRRIGKDPTTVSKEVKLHAKNQDSGFTKTTECCPKLLKAPFVCNGGEKRNRSNCFFPRRKLSQRWHRKNMNPCSVRPERVFH